MDSTRSSCFTFTSGRRSEIAHADPNVHKASIASHAHEFFSITFRVRPCGLRFYCCSATRQKNSPQSLSTDAARRLKEDRGDAPEFSYYLNYTGLDRYNRQGVSFVFDTATKRFHYDGAAWRELIRRYPRSSAAADEAKKTPRLCFTPN